MDKIDFKKYKVKFPSAPKPNNKHYKKMIKKVRRTLPRVNGV